MTQHFPMTINGADAEAAKTLDVVNPANGEVIATVPDAGREELEQVIAAARAAFPAWSRTPYAERQAKIMAMGQIINENLPELTRLLMTEQGKSAEQAGGEVGASAYWCFETAKLELPNQVIEDTPEHRVELRHVPLGVVAGIAPWNFPVMMATWKIIPALLAGNTVVLKPSPFTPLTALRMGQLLRDTFPAGVLNIITGGDALGPMMTSHPGFAKISFTGSSATGRKVMESAAPTLKRLTLELGGNDAAIVFPDVDVEETARSVFWGAFSNSGQICTATKRAYVHEDIYEPFKAKMIELAGQIKVGPASEQGSMLGPVQNKPQYDRVKNLLDDCKAQGYNVITPGTAPDAGYFIPLTLVDNPPESARIVQEEQFGPVLPLIKFSDEDDVIARTNATDYGLGGSIWTKDEERALRVAEQIQSGNVWINETMAVSPHAVFGGHKQSGIGRENGVPGLIEFTNTQTVTIRRKVG